MGYGLVSDTAYLQDRNKKLSDKRWKQKREGAEARQQEVIIEADKLSFSYEDGTKVLKNISLSIKKGRKIALMGANGSGKSTFFLCLNGIHKPSQGRLLYEGKPYDYSRKGLLDLRKKVGIVFQDPDNQIFLPDILQEISFGVLNTGVPREQARSLAEEVIGQLGITPFRSTPTHALSGGQKKQVSIAGVLAMNPQVVILDEPEASLDSFHSRLIAQMTEKMTNQGITVIKSTHDVDFAYQWADEIIVFDKGEVLLIGPPCEVFSQVDILKQAHLTQPSALKLFYSLRKKGVLTQPLPPPKTLKDLEGYLEKIRPQVYDGKGKKEGKDWMDMKQEKHMEKRAILLVSFGTSHNDTRIKTIDAIERDVADAFPDYVVYTAWTSKMIIEKIRQRDHVHVHTVKEAMEQMNSDGITHVTVQPTHIINGIENDRMKEDAMAYKDRFSSLLFGMPLLSETEDSFRVIQVLMEELGKPDTDTALVFMGHGTTHYANSVYALLDYQFKDMGYDNVYIGTVEAYPSMENLKRMIKEGGYKKIILTPFMIVAGDHAKHDMAGGRKDSWKCQFEELGYDLSCLMKGLGEYKGIRSLFLRHIRQAMGQN